MHCFVSVQIALLAGVLDFVEVVKGGSGSSVYLKIIANYLVI